MSFKLPGTPSVRARPHELADFAECVTLLYGECSARLVERYLGQLDDNAENEGIEDSDLVNEEQANRMLVEISHRRISAAGGYPFAIDENSATLSLLADAPEPQATLYRYLLLATRLDMRSQRVFAGIDGTELFECLASYILRDYLHPRRARAMVFGTAANGRFADKVDELCRQVREGGRFRNTDGIRVQANDDKLDVVGWLPFADGQSSQITLFGQCKTGTDWSDTVTQLQPHSFTERWMERTYQTPPVKAFFIAESHDREQWEATARNAKLLFDRCRIVEMAGQEFFSDADVEENQHWRTLVATIQQWSQAALDHLVGMKWARSLE